MLLALSAGRRFLVAALPPREREVRGTSTLSLTLAPTPNPHPNPHPHPSPNEREVRHLAAAPSRTLQPCPVHPGCSTPMHLGCTPMHLGCSPMHLGCPPTLTRSSAPRCSSTSSSACCRLERWREVAG
eukprot:scaffold75842_cov45-Phaeocystis_antarctica.AAC.1